MSTESINWLQWLQLVEIPIAAAFVAMLQNYRNTLEQAVAACQEEHRRSSAEMADRMAAFQVKVAEVYATIKTVRDIRDELIEEMRRLSDKLDRLHSRSWETA